MGLVIGTFGSLPYVHLHLESRRRWYPEMPVLVHDDASDQTHELRALCAAYSAEFRTTDQRRGHYEGDLAVFQRGFAWAGDRGLDLLVKMSRRFVPLCDWVPSLQALVRETQYATYTNRNGDGFGFRTDCIAMDVPAWVDTGAVVALTREGLQKAGIFEVFFHHLAREVHGGPNDANRAYERAHPKPYDFAAYGDWDFMGNDLTRKYPQYLWRANSDAVDYCRAAWQYGLCSYSPDDFARVEL